MSEIFCVTSGNKSIGCTFLDWSIHWLSGSEKYYNVAAGWCDVPKNPLDGNNSHYYNKNQPMGYLNSIDFINILKANGTELSSFYPIPKNTQQAAIDLDISLDQIESNSSKITEYQQKDYAEIWEHCYKTLIPIVYVNLDSSDHLYLSSDHRSLDYLNIEDLKQGNLIEQKFESKERLWDHWLNEYFGKDFDIWKNQMGMVNLWDLREFIALNIRPYEERSNMVDKIDFRLPHLHINAKELWHAGDSTILRIMDYLNLEINPDRFKTWLPIYYKWQEIQLNILKFSWNVDHICKCIVNNYNFDLSYIKLDTWKEAVIQHEMIYKYGLNFKTWQLEKFPTNTQDLHKLLEPNTIHQVKDIYGLLKDSQ
jgi:hypothetical protein